MRLIVGIILFLVANNQLMAQTEKYFKHLIFRETPYSKTKGRIQLSEDQIKKENYFKLKFDEYKRLVLIEYRYKDSLIDLSRSGILDGKRSLASKTKIEYVKDKEIRTFFDKNNEPIVNGMGVFKEIYYYNKKGKRIALKYYNMNDEPVNNSWKVHEYTWEHIDNNSVLEKRKDTDGEYVSMRPYYKFYNVIYKYNDKGILLSMNNVDDDLNLINEETGMAIDVATYDKNDNLINFKFLNANKETVVASPWGVAGGFATYDDKGNCLKYATVGLDGNYLLDKRNNDAYSRYKFDSIGNLIERSNFDIENSILKRNGIVKVRYVYDQKDPLKFLKTEFHHVNYGQVAKDTILERLNIKIEKEKLEEDFNQLLGILKNHPSQFKFTDKDSYNRLVNKQRRLIKDSMNVKEFYQLVTPIVTSLGCLHTRIVNTNFFRTPYKYWLPLIIRFEKNKMYAVNNCVENTEMNLGSEILEINGVTAKDIYKMLKQTISADAFNEQFYKGDLNVNFMYYYHSYYGFDSKYKIRFKPLGANKVIETVFYINEPAPNYKTEIESKPRLNLTIQKEKEVAIIGIKNFNFFSRGKQNIDYFKKELDAFIDKIKELNIKKVVFDFRGNRGGNPECTRYLLSYIASKEIDFYVDNKINNVRNRPITVLPKIDNLANHNIYMLIDGRCASATSQMLAVVKYNKLAKIIGEETGGGSSTFPGKRVKSLINTKLSLQLGTEQEFVQVASFPLNRGVVPDVLMHKTINDIIKRRTPLLDYIYLDNIK